MFNVTAEATDGAKNKGVDNYGSSPTMNGVAALASGGNVNYGIENGGDSEPATPTMTNVTATAIDGATSNHGVYNSVLGAPEIRSSAISGATASITNDGGSASISDTLLEGGGAASRASARTPRRTRRSTHPVNRSHHHRDRHGHLRGHLGNVGGPASNSPTPSSNTSRSSTTANAATAHSGRSPRSSTRADTTPAPHDRFQQPVRAKPGQHQDAVRAGLRPGLIAVRRLLADLLDTPGLAARIVAPAARALTDVIAKVEALPDPAAPPTVIDEIVAKRQARQEAAQREQRTGAGWPVGGVVSFLRQRVMWVSLNGT